MTGQPPAPASLAAALADRYRVERELGAGGMATVYLAHDLRHDRAVAVKVLRADLGAILGSERFLSEIRTTARLQHPHILPLLDSGEADGLLFYVMPLVTGETLRSRLDRERQLPVDDALRIAGEIADALGYAHDHSVIHRDIKPENVLLQGGHALVADFGIALAVVSAGGKRMTETGLSLGTPQYMSPEQAMGERSIDARSDIYALGAVTYEMLVGEPPFTGPSVQAIEARLATEEPRAIRVQRRAVPEHVEQAVLRALEKLPADRFATAAQFGAALQGRAISGDATPRRGTAAPAAVRGLARPARIATGLGLIAAGALAGWAVVRGAPADTPEAAAPTITSILAPAGGNFAEQRSLALSPDGRRLAFVFAAGDGSRMLWMRDLGRLDAEPIPRTSGARAPFWSPDGRSLAWFADGHLAVLDEGGEPRRLCPVADPTGGSWSAAGTILFGHRDGLSAVPATGGECRVVIPRRDESMLRGVFLPGTERFLYARGRAVDMAVADLRGAQLATLPLRTSGDFGVVEPGYVILPTTGDVRALDAQLIDLRTFTLRGPARRLVSNVRGQAGIPTFAVSPAGSFAYLPGSADRPYLEYDGGGMLRDTVRVENTWTLHVRPRRAGPPLVAVAGNRAGLWLYDLDADRATRLPVRDSSTAAPGTALAVVWPVFRPDGSRLVFLRPAAGRCRILERDLATDAERLLVQVASPDPFGCPLPLDWSPDGRRLLVARDSVLQLVALDGGAAVVREIVRPGRLWEGRFSPDGRAMAFSSDETGRAEVYVQPLASGPPVRVSLEGGRWPAWTHAGRRLTFLTPDGRVQTVSLAAGPTGPVGTPRTLFTAPTWRRSTFDDRGTGFAVVGEGERYLLRQSSSGLAVAFVQHWPALLRARP